MIVTKQKEKIFFILKEKIIISRTLGCIVKYYDFNRLNLLFSHINFTYSVSSLD